MQQAPGHPVNNNHLQQAPIVNQTQVIMTSQAPVVEASRDWSTGTCGCFDDCSGCIAAMFCPLFYQCHLSSRSAESCFTPIIPGGMIALRTKLRVKNNIRFSFSLHSVWASQRFCGKHLSDSLSLVCGGRGFFWQEDKRTGVPVVAKRPATEFLSGNERHFQNRGIIQECCENPCTLMDLENYCATDNKADLASTAEIERLLMNKPLSSGEPNSDTATQPVAGDHVTSNPQLLSRLQDLRARLLGSEASRSRLVSHRPFFFVRPISRRPTRTNLRANNSDRLNREDFFESEVGPE
ncbi:uncharacterized protein LOC135461954 [Liolophura sinensis]|uniref:uncharacterized protein LOC135461954 n=1 Tax=Liolophura sinensis TaxID=3198878 RepID=UPI00315882FA